VAVRAPRNSRYFFSSHQLNSSNDAIKDSDFFYDDPDQVHVLFINAHPIRVAKCREAGVYGFILAIDFDSVKYAAIVNGDANASIALGIFKSPGELEIAGSGFSHIFARNRQGGNLNDAKAVAALVNEIVRENSIIICEGPICSIEFWALSTIAAAHQASLISEICFPGGYGFGYGKNADEETRRAAREVSKLMKEVDGSTVFGVEVVVKSGADLAMPTEATIVIALEGAPLALNGSKFVVAVDLSHWNVEMLPEDFASSCRRLVFVKFPPTLKGLGPWSFMDCESLVRVSLSSAVGLKEIGSCSFLRCRSLREVDVPPSLTRICGYAFADCGIVELDIWTFGRRACARGECAVGLHGARQIGAAVRS
jgi:hypothetical protein